MTSGMRTVGMRTFGLVWLGQSVSLVGSRLTAFAIGVWVFQQTGSVTLFTLISFFATLPAVAFSPLAGALADRWDRRRVMIGSDVAAALASALLLALLASDALQIWHVYVAVGLASAANAFQAPAYMAAITLLVPKEHFGRASGMMQFGESGARILGPLLGGLLVVEIGMQGVIGVDLATFFVAVATLLAVSIPRPPAAPGPRRSLWSEAGDGWRHLRERPELLALLGYFAMLNFLVPVGLVLATPMVLAFATVEQLGFVLAASSAGALAGSLVMSVWGGPAKRMTGILGFSPLLALGFVAAGLRPSVPLAAGGFFLAFFVVPVVNGCSQAIWQTKVRPDLQGRVFAVRRMVTQVTAPLAFFVAGPLAERAFEPLLLPGGALAGSLGPLLGLGQGRGIALLVVAAGLAVVAITGWGLLWPGLRDVEKNLPDALELPDARRSATLGST